MYAVVHNRFQTIWVPLVCANYTRLQQDNFLEDTANQSYQSYHAAAFERWPIWNVETSCPSSSLHKRGTWLPNLWGACLRHRHQTQLYVRDCTEPEHTTTIPIPILVGGWPTPLENMKVSWDDYSQYMASHESHVPNYQPAMSHAWPAYPACCGPCSGQSRRWTWKCAQGISVVHPVPYQEHSSNFFKAASMKLRRYLAAISSLLNAKNAETCWNEKLVTLQQDSVDMPLCIQHQSFNIFLGLANARPSHCQARSQTEFFRDVYRFGIVFVCLITLW